MLRNRETWTIGMLLVALLFVTACLGLWLVYAVEVSPNVTTIAAAPTGPVWEVSYSSSFGGHDTALYPEEGQRLHVSASCRTGELYLTLTRGETEAVYPLHDLNRTLVIDLAEFDGGEITASLTNSGARDVEFMAWLA